MKYARSKQMICVWVLLIWRFPQYIQTRKAELWKAGWKNSQPPLLLPNLQLLSSQGSLPPLLLASPAGMNGLHRAVEMVLRKTKAPLLKTKREVICQNPNFSLAPKQISLYLLNFIQQMFSGLQLRAFL